MYGKAAAAQELLEQHAALATQGDDGGRIPSERVNDAGSIDAAPAGGLAAGEDVGAVLEDQSVGRDVAVDGRVCCEGENQAFILPIAIHANLFCCRRHPLFKAYLSLGAICFFWGTTYLGIRMALESFPPMVLVSTRFILSGGVMLFACLIANVQLPRGRELRATTLNGVLILGIGNTCLTIAELWIPSGLAALIITTSPLWMVGIDAVMPGGDRLRPAAMAGILIGGGGAVLLMAPRAAGAELGSRLWGAFILLQLANFAWSFGSIRQRRMPALAHPIVSGAIQQLAAGLACLPFALLTGGQPITWQPRATFALLYLSVFGSIVGYSAYVYAWTSCPWLWSRSTLMSTPSSPCCSAGCSTGRLSAGWKPRGWLSYFWEWPS